MHSDLNDFKKVSSQRAIEHEIILKENLRNNTNRSKPAAVVLQHINSGPSSRRANKQYINLNANKDPKVSIPGFNQINRQGLQHRNFRRHFSSRAPGEKVRESNQFDQDCCETLDELVPEDNGTPHHMAFSENAAMLAKHDI